MHPKEKQGAFSVFQGAFSRESGAFLNNRVHFGKAGCISRCRGLESRVHFPLPWFAMALLQQPYTRAKEDHLQMGKRSFPKLKIPHQSHADFCSTDTAGGLDNKKRRYAPRGGVAYRLFLWGFPKGATPPFGTRLDFAKQSVVCYTLCRRCRENAVAAGEGKGI